MLLAKVERMSLHGHGNAFGVRCGQTDHVTFVARFCVWLWRRDGSFDDTVPGLCRRGLADRIGPDLNVQRLRSVGSLDAAQRPHFFQQFLDFLLDFLEQTYAAAADLAKWDRAALER